MTGAEALPSRAERDWRSSWGLPKEGKQPWRSGRERGWEPVLELLLNPSAGRDTLTPSPAPVFVQAAGHPESLPGCAGLFYGQAMRYGWDFGEWQVCAGEADFQLSRWVAFVPATGIPRRAGDSPELSPRPNATNSLGCNVQGARKEEEEAGLHTEVVSQNQELQTLISSHLLMRIRT